MNSPIEVSRCRDMKALGGMHSPTSYLQALALSASLFACVDSSTEQTSDDNTDLTGQACPVSGTDIHKSLVVTDAAILKKFTFARTFGQVLSSSGSTSQTGTQVFQQWMSTFGPTDCTNPKVDPNHYGEVCPRNNELLLAGVDPTDPTSKVQFEAVGLFNRFDLAPASGATCGEYRI